MKNVGEQEKMNILYGNDLEDICHREHRRNLKREM